MTNTTHPLAAPAYVAGILEEIKAFTRRFVIFADPTHYDIAALWVFHTHCFAAAYATPYLYVKSAEPQCGKTRTIETLELLAHNPKTTANMSPGALYAAIESQSPTIMLDEVDAVFTGGLANEDLRGMLNSGYKMGGTVERQTMVSGGIRETVSYSTFCPKLLAGIDNGTIPATIADRCIVFDLKRKLRTEPVERMNYRVVTPQAEELRERVHACAMACIEKLALITPADIDDISDRAFEIAEPLLAIGMLAQGWTKRTREAVIHLNSQRKPAETLQVKALRIARDLFADGERDRITSVEFAEAMGMTPPKASRILTPHGISTTTIKFPSHTAKGFRREDFVDAWDRYLDA